MNDRKRAVLQTAQRLFIENGFNTTSIQDILEEANISKGTFYNYFSSKNECLMAILRHAHNLAFLRRSELTIGRDASDKQLLAEQLLIRLHVNREQNLLPLLETIIHSPDMELRNFVKELHYKELVWIAGRLVEIYGEKIRPYSYDCATMILGILQHTISIWIGSSKQAVDTERLVAYVVSRMDGIIPDLLQTEERLLPGELVESLLLETNEHLFTKEELIAQLQEFERQTGSDSHPQGKEYTRFLAEELSEKAPRPFLLTSIARSLRQTFEATEYERDAVKLAANIWAFVRANEG